MILTVKDTGVGISNEMADLIFEPFLQLPQEHNRPGSGLGIGLSLTKRLVELHKGTISVTSEGLNTGAEFTVKLPAPSHVQLPIPKTDDAVGKTSTLENGRSLRVLVVDDNEAAANGLRELLKIKGHNVWVESDGESTLRASKEFNPHAIVLDIGLPDMSGYEVAEKLRSDGSKAMLIALTGYGQDEDKMRAERAGFDRHLTKPIGIAELEHELQHVTVGTT